MLMIVACWCEKGTMLRYASNFSTYLSGPVMIDCLLICIELKKFYFTGRAREINYHQLKYQALKGLQSQSYLACGYNLTWVPGTNRMQICNRWFCLLSRMEKKARFTANAVATYI